MANLDEISKIYDKYVSGTMSKEEQQKLFEFFDTANDDDIRTVIAPYMERDDEPKDLRHLDDKTSQIFEQIRVRTQPAPKRSMLWLYTAAAAILIIIGGIPFMIKDVESLTPQVLTDLAPGTTGATLTLADGSRVALGDKGNGTIATQGAVRIFKNADGELTYSGQEILEMNNTLTTDRGQTYNLTLPDGTKVWLNAASKLTYPASFTKMNERFVELDGEAYFEVAKSPGQTFVVKSGSQRVQVLGTKFNINSYADEQAQVTTLAEGSVRVYPTTDAKFLTLAPGNEIVNNGNRSYQRLADLETALAWKDGKMYFKDASLVDVLKQVSRWYNVEIDYASVKTNETFTGGIKRTANLSQLLKILELSDVHCSIVKKDNVTTLTVK